MSTFSKLCTVAALSLSVLFCSSSQGGPSGVIPEEPANPIDPGSEPSGQTLDFEDLPAGTVVEELFGTGGTGPIGVNGLNRQVSDNAALVFDSGNPTGGDSDLGTPNEDFGGPGVGAGGSRGAPFENDTPLGKLLIVAADLIDENPADGLIDVPNDARVIGNVLSFDFTRTTSGAVTMESITIVDVESDEPVLHADLFDDAGRRIVRFTMVPVGDNGVGTFSLGPTAGVARLDLVFNGSGAVDDIVFTP